MARWTFGELVLDLGTRELLRAGTPVSLSPKALHLLSILVEHQTRALSKAELQERLWPGTFVVEKNLTNLISEIREAIGEDPAHPQFIRTVPRYGYAFRGATSAEPHERPAHNLPAPLTTFIGREREMAKIHSLMAAARLLTLTGAGGCGKTRLALETAAAALDRFADGVWFVDLAALSDPGLLSQTVASALGLREGPGRSISDALADFVRTRRLLLVLDNCEHLIAACAPLAEALLRAGAGLCILATSREGLGLAGETVWRVPSLSLPESVDAPPGDALLESDALRLFVARAAASDSTFAFTHDNASVVAEVCRRLDGIPLAIELAAARLRVLSIDQIHARLHDRFALLTGGSRTAVARQRTLEATVQWSYDLLSDPERRLLHRLSVFAGGWTIEAAEDVTTGDGIERQELLDLLSRLLDKSLVHVEPDAGGDRRYRFLETVRQYARERLLQSGEAGRLRDRHLAFFYDLARRAEPELLSHDQVAWLNRLFRDHDNLRLALEWCLATPERREQSAQFAVALAWFWLKRPYFREGQDYLERVLATGAEIPVAVRARVIMMLGCLTFFQGDLARTRALLNESAALGRTAGDLAVVSFSLGINSVAALELGDYAECARLATEGQEVARASEVPFLAGPSLASLGYLAIQRGDLDTAGRLHEEVLDLSRQVGDKWGMGITLCDLAILRLVQQRNADARSLCAEGIALSQEFGDRRGIAWCLGILSGADATDGRALRAARLRGAMEGLLESVGAPVQASYHQWIGDRALALMKETLGEPAFQAALAEGRAMSLSRAIQFGLNDTAT